MTARQSHKRTIEQAVAAEFENYNSLTIIGSHTRDTAIHELSDVDYFAMLGVKDVIRAGSRVRSTTTLSRLKATLEVRFPTTPVRIDGPAVVVQFGRGAVDVVPGIWVGTVGNPGLADKAGYPLYEIPNGEGGWLQTSPRRHKKYLCDADDRAVSKLSRTVKLIKCWKYARSPSVPLLAFHLELLLASESVCVGPKSYAAMLLEAFQLLRDRAGEALEDPLDISGEIQAVRTRVQADALMNHADYAADHAERAVEAEDQGNVNEAFRQWDLVFNGEFPARY